MCVVIEDLIKGIIYFLGYLIAVFLGAPLISRVLSTLELGQEQKKTLSGIKGAERL